MTSNKPFKLETMNHFTSMFTQVEIELDAMHPNSETVCQELRKLGRVPYSVLWSDALSGAVHEELMKANQELERLRVEICEVAKRQRNLQELSNWIWRDRLIDERRNMAQRIQHNQEEKQKF
jgi:hypothetical protein